MPPQATGASTMDSNPYRSPEPGSGGPAPTGQRPTSLLVFGILNIVFGVIGLCGTAASSAMFFVDLPRDPTMPNPALDLIESDATYRLFLQTMIVLGCLAALALIVGGIGLLLVKAWGRTLSIGYAWYAIVGAVAGMIVQWVYIVQPMLAQAQGQDEGLGRAAAAVGAVSGLVGGCLSMIYPVVLLIFMYRPAVRAAVAPPEHA
jgi:hypothetical protein